MKLLHVRQDQNHMATTFTFRVSCEESRAGLASRILTDAHALVSRLERELSEFLPESPVFQLNHAAPRVRVKLTEDGLELLERAERLRLLTEGAFDCAAKSTSRPASGPAFAW